MEPNCRIVVCMYSTIIAVTCRCTCAVYLSHKYILLLWNIFIMSGLNTFARARWQVQTLYATLYATAI